MSREEPSFLLARIKKPVSIKPTGFVLVAGAARIELALTVLETAVLPLNYAPIISVPYSLCKFLTDEL